MSNVNKVFWKAVFGQINNDRNHGWVAKDSLPVVEAIVAEDASEFAEGIAKAARLPESEEDFTALNASYARYTPSDCAMARIGDVVNPSGFRQQLEKKIKWPVGHQFAGLTILQASGKTRDTSGVATEGMEDACKE